MADVQKTLAQIIGVVLTIVGIAGFFTGGTLVIFGVNTLHNVVHIVTGLIALWAGFSGGGANATAFNKYAGIVYLIVFVAGFVPAVATLLNINTADAVLHAALGIILVGVGYGVKSA